MTAVIKKINKNIERMHAKSVVTLPSGRYAFRYPAKSTTPNNAETSVIPRMSGQALVSASPQMLTPILRKPGDFLVIAVIAPTAELVIEIVARSRDALDRANIEVVRLEKQATAPRSLKGKPISLLSRGEQIEPVLLSAVINNEPVVAPSPIAWLADPEKRQRVQAIRIDWAEKPDQIDIEYAVTFEESGTFRTVSSRVGSLLRVPAGASIGGFTARLVGRKAKQFELRWQCVFDAQGYGKLCRSGDESRGRELISIRLAVISLSRL